MTPGRVNPTPTRVQTDPLRGQAGFWLLWHVEGGFEGLQRIGMSRSSIYRRISAFRKLMEVHPDE